MGFLSTRFAAGQRAPTIKRSGALARAGDDRSRSSSASGESVGKSRPEAPSSGWTRLPPPKKNRVLLAFATLLLVGWLVALAILALAT